MVQLKDDVLSTFKASEKLAEDMVIILGNYDGKKNEIFLRNIKKNLERLSSRLRTNEHFYGVTIKEIQNPTEIRLRTPRRLLHRWLSTCGFVIADDTVPSGVLTELEHCRNCGTITAIISRPERKGRNPRRSSFMTLDHDIHSSDFEVFEYLGDIYDNTGIQGFLLKKVIPFFRKRRNKVEQAMKKKRDAYSKNKKR